MKMDTIYTCDFCGHSFYSQRDCEAHEKRHVTVEKVLQASYDTERMWEKDCNYIFEPETIRVKLSNGVVARYKRCKE